MPRSRWIWKMKRPEPKAQIERFREAARELGAEEDGSADELLRRMAKMKPEPRKKPPPRKRDKPEDDKPGQ